MSSPRFVSEKRLEFHAPGRPAGTGRVRPNGEHACSTNKANAQAYRNIIRLCAKAAVAEQGWELTEDSVYLVLTIYLKPTSDYRNALKKRMLKGELMTPRHPRAIRIGQIAATALKGIVYKDDQQVAGLVITKIYAEEEGLDVLVGVPKNRKELLHDVRNA